MKLHKRFDKGRVHLKNLSDTGDKMLRTKPIAEDRGDFHEFTVTFWKDRVMLERHSFPLGALTTQVLNLDPQELVHIHNLCALAIQKLKGQFFDPRVPKDYFLLSDIQKSVNAALQEIRKLPVYNLLQVDEETAYHLLTALWQNRDEFQRAMQVGSVENQMLCWKVGTIPTIAIMSRPERRSELAARLERTKKKPVRRGRPLQGWSMIGRIIA